MEPGALDLRSFPSNLEFRGFDPDKRFLATFPAPGGSGFRPFIYRYSGKVKFADGAIAGLFAIRMQELAMASPRSVGAEFAIGAGPAGAATALAAAAIGRSSVFISDPVDESTA